MIGHSNQDRHGTVENGAIEDQKIGLSASIEED
jgi:hypothetical protein